MDDIWDYIATELENLVAAGRVVNSIMDRVDDLEAFPEMGTPVSSIFNIETDHRFISSGNYLIFYRAYSEKVYIDRVLYGRRDYLRILFDNMATAVEE